MAGQKKIFLERIRRDFTVEYVGKKAVYPSQKGEFGMYLEHEWYKLTVHPDKTSDDPVDGLDVSDSSDESADPVLGIEDPRTDENIEFVGGIRGLGELEKCCHEDITGRRFQCILHPCWNCWPWLMQDGSCRRNPHGLNKIEVRPVHPSNRK